jgi:hypothetical protein
VASLLVSDTFWHPCSIAEYCGDLFPGGGSVGGALFAQLPQVVSAVDCPKAGGRLPTSGILSYL